MSTIGSSQIIQELALSAYSAAIQFQVAGDALWVSARAEGSTWTQIELFKAADKAYEKAGDVFAKAAEAYGGGVNGAFAHAAAGWAYIAAFDAKLAAEQSTRLCSLILVRLLVYSGRVVPPRCLACPRPFSLILVISSASSRAARSAASCLVVGQLELVPLSILSRLCRPLARPTPCSSSVRISYLVLLPPPPSSILFLICVVPSPSPSCRSCRSSPRTSPVYVPQPAPRTSSSLRVVHVRARASHSVLLRVVSASGGTRTWACDPNTATVFRAGSGVVLTLSEDEMSDYELRGLAHLRQRAVCNGSSVLACTISQWCQRTLASERTEVGDLHDTLRYISPHAF
ncbi:hypothetical protein C8R43DRAFT_1131514 [Mycena crocata]|nr:hypothetical protein C8R43DRAFT_1131514 [Mycena crocata]